MKNDVTIKTDLTKSASVHNHREVKRSGDNH